MVVLLEESKPSDRRVRKGVLTDKELGERYNSLIELGEKTFADTALLDEDRDITREDLVAIGEFHREAAPTNPDHPWRLGQRPEFPEGEIRDGSYFGNWESPGGPLEHIQLATKAAEVIANLLKKHKKEPTKDDPEWVKNTSSQIENVQPLLVAAAAGLHDEGRELTHTFFTTDLIGDSLLRRIGIRQDVRDNMPTEDVMLVPSDESMDEKIQSLSAEQVIVRLADEFGKRFPKSNRLYKPSDYDTWDRDAWARNYINRPDTGRPSDRHMRANMQLHVDNVPRYFKALDNWLQACTNLTLDDLVGLSKKTRWFSSFAKI